MAKTETDPNAPTGSNSDTRITPTDEAALDYALRTGDVSRLNDRQKAMYIQMLQQAAGAKQAAAEQQMNTSVTQGRQAAGLTSASSYPSSQGSTTYSKPMTANEIATMATQQQAISIANPAPEAEPVMVMRKPPTRTPTVGITSPSAPPQAQRAAPSTSNYRLTGGSQSTIDQYLGEYGQKISDPSFRDWITRRAAVLGGVSDPTKIDPINMGLDWWQLAGTMVASNPQLQKSMTPEQWLDNQYRLMGGDQAYQTLLDDAEAANNPISTNTQTTNYTINRVQAQAMIDSMSQSLLGRMASDSELKKARAAVQKLLTPTVATTTTDNTDPSNSVTTQSVKSGIGPDEARDLLAMRMRRGSEGMAFNVGSLFESAMKRMAP